MLNYTQLVENKEKTYLYDENAEGLRLRQLDELAATYVYARDRLAGANYPFNAKWILTIARHGSEGLARLARSDAREAAVRMQMPPYLVDGFVQSAADGIPADLRRAADEIAWRVGRACDGLPLAPSDVHASEDGERVEIDRPAVVERIAQACRVEVTGEMRAAASELLEIAARLREIELTGLNALELVERWADTPAAPDECAVLGAVLLRRHPVGTLYTAGRRMLPTLAAGVMPPTPPAPSAATPAEPTPAPQPMGEGAVRAKNEFLKEQGLL